MKLILFSVVACFFIAESIGNPKNTDTLITNFDDSDESNVKDIWQNEYQDELYESHDGLHGFQDEDEELDSSFVDSDDFNAEDIWKNEDPNKLDEFDDGLYEFQDEDDELGKIKTATYQGIKTHANLIKIPGSKFDDSNDSNAEQFLQNEDSVELDDLDDGLYGFQDEDEELVPAMTSPFALSSRNDERKRAKRNCPACCPRCRTMACDNKEICPIARDD